MPNNTLPYVQRNDVKTVEYWNKFLLGMIKLEESNFVFAKLGKEVNIPMNAGTTTWSARRYNHLPVDITVDGQGKAAVEGVAPTLLRVEAQKVTGTISQYMAGIEITDVVDEVHEDDIRQIYTPELARHAAEVRERHIMAKFVDASDWFVNNRASVNEIEEDDVLTLKEVRKANLTMQNYNRDGHVKFGRKPVLVVHNNVMNDLLDDEDLQDRMLVPGNDNTPIKFGNLENYLLYGFYVVSTNIAAHADSARKIKTEDLAVVDGKKYYTLSDGTYTLVSSPLTANIATYYEDAPVHVFTSYLLGKDPYVVIGLGSQNVKFVKTDFKPDKSDPFGQKATVGYKMWLGAKVVDPIAITCIYSASAYEIPTLSDDLGAAADQTDIE